METRSQKMYAEMLAWWIFLDSTIGSRTRRREEVEEVVVVVVAVVEEKAEKDVVGAAIRMLNLYPEHLRSHYDEMRLLSSDKWLSIRPSPFPIELLAGSSRRQEMLLLVVPHRPLDPSSRMDLLPAAQQPHNHSLLRMHCLPSPLPTKQIYPLKNTLALPDTGP